MLSRINSSFDSYLMFLTSVGLIACGNPSLGEQPVVSGQISNWNYDASQSSLRALVLPGVYQSITLASAPIDGSGRFSITLPGAADMAPYLRQQHVDSTQATPLSYFSGFQPPQPCPGNNLHSDQQDFATATLQLGAFHGGIGGPIWPHASSNVPTNPNALLLITYVFADRDVNESGSISCTQGSMTVDETIDVHFTKGWNLQSDTYIGSKLNSATTVTLPADTPLTWNSSN